jgi:hypothetical protein
MLALGLLQSSSKRSGRSLRALGTAQGILGDGNRPGRAARLPSALSRSRFLLDLQDQIPDAGSGTPRGQVHRRMAREESLARGHRILASQAVVACSRMQSNQSPDKEILVAIQRWLAAHPEASDDEL